MGRRCGLSLPTGILPRRSVHLILSHQSPKNKTRASENGEGKRPRFRLVLLLSRCFANGGRPGRCLCGGVPHISGATCPSAVTEWRAEQLNKVSYRLLSPMGRLRFAERIRRAKTDVAKSYTGPHALCRFVQHGPRGRVGLPNNNLRNLTDSIVHRYRRTCGV
jgi:hypothetical protein